MDINWAKQVRQILPIFSRIISFITKRSRGSVHSRAVSMSPTDDNANESLYPAEDDNFITDTVEVSDDAAVSDDDSKFRKLYIDGLPLTTSESDIRSYFEKWGEIEEFTLTSTTTILCCLTFAFPASIDDIQASRPHKIGSTVVETRRILPDSQPIKKLYVGSIKGGTTTGHIFATFSRFGRVRAVDMIKDKVTGRCRGFCFVSFDDYDSTDKCLLALPIVLNRKVVRVQKAIPISEMKSSGSEDFGNNYTHQRVGGNQRSESCRELRRSTSSTDSDMSEGSSVFEGPFDHVPYSSTPSDCPLPRNDSVFMTKQSARRWSCPAQNPYMAYTMVNYQPSSLPVRNYSYKSGLTNLKAPYTCPTFFVPYLNNSTPTSLQYPIYPNTLTPNSSPQNGYPFSYNIACSNVSDSNLCFPFVLKHNQNVPYTPLPTAPMIVPVSMCNHARPNFVGSYQKAYV